MRVQEANQKETVAAIIPAAGTGSRMGGTPKQLRLLGDAPVLVHTLRAFAGVEELETVVVAVPKTDVDAIAKMVAQFGLDVRVIAGGSSRQESVGEGLRVIGHAADLVLVHDAVRPFITSAAIEEIVAAIREHGAAAVAVPVADTLRRAGGGLFGETVDREGLFRMLTPQGARISLLAEAHNKAVLERFVATDEVELLQRIGVVVSLVIGDERNIKLTRPSDWELAEALWPAWQKHLE